MLSHANAAVDDNEERIIDFAFADHGLARCDFLPHAGPNDFPNFRIGKSAEKFQRFNPFKFVVRREFFLRLLKVGKRGAEIRRQVDTHPIASLGLFLQGLDYDAA